MAKDAKKASKNKDVKNKGHFFKDFKAELKKVIWPTPKQLANKTVAVIVIVLITALIVFVLDVVFDLLNQNGINRIKANIKNKAAVESNVENAEESVEAETQDSQAIENESKTENAE